MFKFLTLALLLLVTAINSNASADDVIERIYHFLLPRGHVEASHTYPQGFTLYTPEQAAETVAEYIERLRSSLRTYNVVQQGGQTAVMLQVKRVENLPLQATAEAVVPRLTIEDVEALIIPTHLFEADIRPSDIPDKVPETLLKKYPPATGEIVKETLCRSTMGFSSYISASFL